MANLHIINIIVLCIALYLGWRYFSSDQKLVKDKLDSHYDYIIVGAGSAGSVIANRLSEDPSVTVAVLEAGKEETEYPESSIPLNFFPLQNTEIDWQYRTVPQTKSCLGMIDNKCAWPRGKVLGGSSQINAMWYVRCNRHDFDRWANVFGADGWSYAEVLPYFIRSEAHENETLVKSGYHGGNGPWKVRVQHSVPELTDLYLKANEEIGSKILYDLNGKEQEGYARMHSFISNGARSSSASAFIRPAMKRANLHVLTEAHVTRILFSGTKAVGVEYVKDGKLLKVHSNKEIILSAGAIGSPHILMLSGVGHKDHLQKFNIPSVADLPVGDNLQDHLFLIPIAHTIDKPVSITVKRKNSILEAAKYQITGKGVLASSGFEAVGFYRSDKQPKNDPRPYMQNSLIAYLMGNDKQLHPIMQSAFNLKDEVNEQWLTPHLGLHGFEEFIGLQRPASTGTIRLQSGNPFQYPLIDPKYLHENIDLENLLSGLRISQKKTDTKAFKDFGAKLIKTVHPLCKHVEYDSDDYWRCFIKHNTFTIYHPTSTCKMGRKTDKTTVVDSQLRVHGIQGLRVADASIMPEVPTGNTNAPSLMIGEKAADLIRGRKKLTPITNL